MSDSPGSGTSSRSSLWFQHCHLLSFIMLSLSVGGGSVDTACCICTSAKATNGCQEWLLLILLPRRCQSLLKRDLSFTTCSRTSEQQSCYSYLVYSFLIWKLEVLLEWAHSTAEFPEHILRSRGTCWDSELSHFLACATPPVHNKQSQNSHGDRKASLRPWTDSLFCVSSFIYVVELSLRRRQGAELEKLQHLGWGTMITLSYTCLSTGSILHFSQIKGKQPPPQIVN